MSTTGASTPRSGYVGEKKQVDRKVLRFADAKAKATYDTLWSCLERDEVGFFHYPMRKIGNFVNEEWCKGVGAHINCAGGDTRKKPGAAWTDLEVLHYPQSWPNVFGLSFSVGEIPEAGLGASLGWSEGGKGILGSGVWFTFFDVRDGDVQLRLSLGMSDAFDVEEDEYRVKADGTAAELFLRVRESPAALRAEIDKRLSDLDAKATEALDRGAPRKCVYGEYEGAGVPPPCIEKVPLTQKELDAARKRLRDYVDPRRAFVAANSEAMHAKLMQLLPAACWKPS